eukprot:TRINITY_DN3088_c0_g1_i1.p1 TRINITY_DN3088_c0_g1~~TRINITY_DN3088_c0_g1_i1.p1  ORF type:complete len:150 (+),score=34.77 TRINITY_DN3088_c0_g1_i1:76-525(+)
MALLSSAIAASLRRSVAASSFVRLGSSAPHGNAHSERAKVNEPIPSSAEGAVGIEREEVLAEVQGKHRFEMEPITGHFGTESNPAVVYSFYNKRTIGCYGNCDAKGEDQSTPSWFTLVKDTPHTCTLCGQVFVLKRDPNAPEDSGHHHH